MLDNEKVDQFHKDRKCHKWNLNLCYVCVSPQSYLTLYDPVDWSSPGSSVPGILQARILEWVAISFSRGSSQFRDGTCISCHLLHWRVGSLPLVPPENSESSLVMVKRKMFWNLFKSIHCGLGLIQVNTRWCDASTQWIKGIYWAVSIC